MDGLGAAAEHLCSPSALLLMMLGTTLGIIVGAMPGLTGAMLIALTLPLTYQMQYANGPLDALILLVSMYVGSISGGLISATLLRMPGTPASMMTTLDGYPMARQGKPGRALGLGITASFVGGMISWVFLNLVGQADGRLVDEAKRFRFLRARPHGVGADLERFAVATQGAALRLSWHSGHHAWHLTLHGRSTLDFRR